MDVIESIRGKLQAVFSPTAINVTDGSAAHYGHDGATPGQVSHVAILVVSDAFAGKSRVERSRMAYGAIAEEVKAIHAVTELKTLTPDEFANLPKLL